MVKTAIAKLMPKEISPKTGKDSRMANAKSFQSLIATLKSLKAVETK